MRIDVEKPTNNAPCLLRDASRRRLSEPSAADGFDHEKNGRGHAVRDRNGRGVSCEESRSPRTRGPRRSPRRRPRQRELERIAEAAGRAARHVHHGDGSRERLEPTKPMMKATTAATSADTARDGHTFGVRLQALREALRRRCGRVRARRYVGLTRKPRSHADVLRVARLRRVCPPLWLSRPSAFR